MNKCAFDREDKCTALREKQCDGCRFRKTEQELNDGRQKAIDRINNLPYSKQIHITRKYHDMNWGKRWS